MNEEISKHFMLSQNLPEFLVWLGAIVFFTLWMRFRDWPGEQVKKTHMFTRFALRWLLCFAGLQCLAEGLMRQLVFASDWPVWAILAGGAFFAELSFELYGFELQSLPKKKGRIIASLRAAGLLLIALILCQPVCIFESTRKIDRHVAILIDGSASMQVPDNGLSPAERARLADSLSIIKTRRDIRMEETSSFLKMLQKEIAAQNDALKSAGTSPNVPSLGLRPLRDASRKIQTQFASHCERFFAIQAKEKLPANPNIKAKLDASSLALKEISAKLAERSKLIATAASLAGEKSAKEKPDWTKIIELSNALAESMQKLEKDSASLGDELDEAFYQSLPELERKKVDLLSTERRIELAEKLLTAAQGHGDLEGKSILSQLSNNYGVKVYNFATTPSELDERNLSQKNPAPAKKKGNTKTPSGNTEADISAMSTNIAAALEKASTDIPPGQLAGILLLSDGRHNTADSPDNVARRLGQAKVPVCCVAMGSAQKPPRDAAVVEARIPDTVYLEDRVQADIELKFDNLAGEKLTVKLMDGKQQVDSRIIEVKSASAREKIQLFDTPKTIGSHSYKVIIEGVAEEVETRNNEFSAPVNVSDDRLKLIYIEGRPRWEFRYLKNLFTGRDSSVKMQYLLFHPDQLAGQPQRPPVPASVKRPISEAEASVLPASDEEWMKFDVIILGDIDPAELGLDAQKSIRKFVEERGGSLVLIAGQSFMPRAYASSPIGELSPATVRTDEIPLVAAPEESFHIELTQEGKEHPIMRLSSIPGDNTALWSSLPPIYWRHPIMSAKPAAAVLAYAMPFNPPDFLKRKSSSEVPDAETQRKRRQFELQNALIISQNYALGKVILMNFDESWRLRYRNGDLYHHKFWGQVLRWATADKIRFGSEHVRIAAGQSRYGSDENITVRARLIRPDFSPLMGAAPLLRVMDGTREVARKNLRLEPNSPGVYQAGLGKLPVGNYSLELDPKGLPAELEGELKAARAGFAVCNSSPSELVELAVDSEILKRLASLSGGLVAEPAMAQSLLGQFGPPSLTQTERNEIALWNSWLMLLLLVCCLSAEWILRKKVSLP